MKILIVDDEFVSQMRLHKVLARFGECVVTDSGIEALTAFKDALKCSVPFHLATIDIVMPELDGKEVLCKIREIERANNITKEKRIKILMVTSDTNTDTVITCAKAGCDDYIVKPFGREKIIKKIEKLGIQN